MKIVHTVLSLDPGGLERVAISLAREQLRVGHGVHILCLERPGTLALDAESIGARIHCAHKGPGLTLRTIREVRRLLSQIQPDVVHTHQIGALFYAGAAARQANIRVIVHTEHGKHYEFHRRLRWLARWSSRHANRFFCVSQDIADAVVARRITSPMKVSVIANGIDTEQFSRKADAAAIRAAMRIPAGALVIGTVGRLAPVKCQDVLLKGFARLPALDGALPHLVLVGGGECETALRQLAASLGISDRAHFAGYQADPGRFLRIMDVFALTSCSEGMPLAVLEAWAAGVPVIASRIGGLVALIDEGRTGRMFSEGDDVNLGVVLRDLLANRNLRERLSDGGRACVAAKYDVSVMAGRYQQHYDDLHGLPAPSLALTTIEPFRVSV